jgi:hypothetical protein
MAASAAKHLNLKPHTIGANYPDFFRISKRTQLVQIILIFPHLKPHTTGEKYFAVYGIPTH